MRRYAFRDRANYNKEACYRQATIFQIYQVLADLRALLP